MAATDRLYTNAEGAMTKEQEAHLDRDLDVMWDIANKPVVDLSGLFEKITQTAGDDVIIRDMASHTSQPQVVANDLTPVPYIVPNPGYKKTITKVIRKLGIRITKDLVQRQRFGQVMNQARGLMMAATRNDEKLRASILNNGFTSGTGSDGQYLFADSHPNIAAETGSWDNLGTGALSPDNLWALVLLQDNMTDPQGDPIDMKSQTVWVPTALRRDALTYVGSAQVADNSLNNEEKVINELTVNVAKEFTSTTAYFLAGDMTGEEKGLYEVVGSDWTMVTNSPSNGDIIVDRHIRSDKAFDFTRSKNLAGSTGA